MQIFACFHPISAAFGEKSLVYTELYLRFQLFTTAQK